MLSKHAAPTNTIEHTANATVNRVSKNFFVKKPDFNKSRENLYKIKIVEKLLNEKRFVFVFAFVFEKVIKVVCENVFIKASQSRLFKFVRVAFSG